MKRQPLRHPARQTRRETSAPVPAPPTPLAETVQAPALPSDAGGTRWSLPVLFSLTVFASATLLFLVQPLIAKLLLPRFGGAPAVWNTCMVFFQVLLLAGYFYAHRLTRLGGRAQVFVHAAVLLLPAVCLPFALPAGLAPGGGDNPVPMLLGMLAAAVGLPFFALAATAPLLQRWFSLTGHPAARDPYFLYAASNLGSMLALLGYPALVEPLLTLPEQSNVWALGYAGLVALLVACGIVVLRGNVAAPGAGSAPVRPLTPAPPWRERLYWVALAFAPSSLLIGVTQFLTTDLAPVPLLWVIPLAIYLLSFIVVFLYFPARLHRVLALALPVLVLILASTNPERDRWTIIGLHLAVFFTAALVCHGQLALRRPAPEHLTEFYLLMSVGGALGGIFNTFVAPAVFNTLLEYPLVMVLASVLALPVRWHWAGTNQARWVDAAPALVGTAVAVAGGVLLANTFFPNDSWTMLYRERTFFGILTVGHEPGRPDVHVLRHGGTTHGMQHLVRDYNMRRLPRMYFDATGPIGQVFLANEAARYEPPIAVIGLGAGSLVSYGHPGQEFVFFEIDPAVERLARDRRFFTYLTEAEVNLRVMIGDARLSLEKEPDDHYGMLVVDAFSSDAIPVHLLTTEAVRLYLRKLTPGGMIAFHISNRYLELRRVLDGIARDNGLAGFYYNDKELNERERGRGKYRSEWVVLARDSNAFKRLPPSWKQEPLPLSPDSPVWTDHFSNVLGVLRW